jgi:hypothetical protein
MDAGMFTDPLIYIRKLENELAEAKKQQKLEQAGYVLIADQGNTERLRRWLQKWKRIIVHSKP